MTTITRYVLHIAFVACAFPAFGQGLLQLQFDDEARVRSRGPWESRVDHRALLAMRHGWAPSDTGNFVSYTINATVPQDWAGPVSLSFYCSDDYDASRSDVPSSLTAEGFVGHRKKEVWVNEEAVWTSDVSDAVEKGVSPYVRVPIKAAPGDAVTITLLVFDTVGTVRPLPGDFFHQPSGAEADAAERLNFQTHVYWGDVYLLDGETAIPRGNRPSQGKVLAVHNRRWPLPAFGRPWDGPIELAVSEPAGIPAGGFPLRMGVPFHAGAVQGEGDVRFVATPSARIPVQTRVASFWPSDSVRWLLLDTIVQPDTTGVRAEMGANPASSGPTPTAQDLDGPVRVTWNEFSFVAGLEDVLYNVAKNDTAYIDALKIRLRTPEGETSLVPGVATVIEQGPARTTIEVEGRFDTADQSLGRARVHLTVFGTLPYIRVWIQLVNDTERDLPVSGLPLSISLAESAETCETPGAMLASGNRVVQSNENTRTLKQSDGDVALPAQAPAYATAGPVTLVVRQFRELFPKALTFEGQTLEADLVAAGARPITFTPGEAKTHEVWLGLGDIDAVSLAAAVDAPPILQNADYFTATGVLGPAQPHEGVAVLHEHMTTAFGDKQWEDFGQRFGVRDFPDSPYYGGLPNWSNNYYERMLNLWSEWYLSGDRAWYALATDLSRHLLDVAIVHSPIPGKDWLGAMHGPGANHVAGPWNPNLRIEGLLQHGQITGDPGAVDAALAVADYCLRTNAGLDGGSVRQQAGPFDAICTAFAETGAIEYLDNGQERVDSVYRALDLRRGVWPDIHGSFVYRGNVPWMNAQMARPLYWWYRLTGDVKAAQALVAMADAVIAENTDWDAAGAVYGYSHNPRFGMTAAYDLLILPMIFAAYELTEDPVYLDAAKAQWERWKASGQFDSPLNCYWNTPWLVDYLKRYDIEGEMEEAQPAASDSPPSE